MQDEQADYKLLILDRIKDPSRANAVMELIANNQGDQALSAVIAEMETVDVARLFSEAFDYTKPNQAAALINPKIAEDCMLAILARRSSSRILENPKGPAQDLSDFLTSVILTRPLEKQAEFRNLIDDHMEVIAACIMCDVSYHGDELGNIISGGEVGTVAEIAKNLDLSDELLRTVNGAMGKSVLDGGGDEDSDSEESSFDSASEERRWKFVKVTLSKFHKRATKKFGAEATTNMDEFMDM